MMRWRAIGMEASCGEMRGGDVAMLHVGRCGTRDRTYRPTDQLACTYFVPSTSHYYLISGDKRENTYLLMKIFKREERSSLQLVPHNRVWSRFIGAESQDGKPARGRLAANTAITEAKVPPRPVWYLVRIRVYTSYPHVCCSCSILEEAGPGFAGQRANRQATPDFHVRLHIRVQK